MTTLYEALGVDKEATQAEIKKAYQRIVQKHHPDKGGDPELFAMAQAAYECLSVKESRSVYDKTGSADADRIKRVAESRLDALFDAMLSAHQLTGNVIHRASEDIDKSSEQFRRQIQELVARRQMVTNRTNRLARTDGENRFTKLAQAKINGYDELMADAKREIAINEIAAEMLASYEDTGSQSATFHQRLG